MAIVSNRPAEVLLRPNTERSTLILATHPQSPCTRAVLDELAVIRATPGERSQIRILFAEAPGGPQERGKR